MSRVILATDCNISDCSSCISDPHSGALKEGEWPARWASLSIRLNHAAVI
jgi:hypothetical protein